MAPQDGSLPGSSAKAVVELSRATLPTRWGDFVIVAFADGAGRRLDDVALIRGDLESAQTVPVRVHSECVTGDAFGSLRCDCGEQLHMAMRRLGDSDSGVLLYMRQEGRGIGIAAKVQAYALQDQGMDTVEANLHLGFDDDLRSYDRAAVMLHVLGVSRIELHTNNPRKLDGLRGAGIEVTRRVPIVVTAHDRNRFYLETKRDRSGHIIEDDE